MKAKLTVGITGASGFLAWHIKCLLHGESDITVIGADRATFETANALTEFARRADVIVHLAGVNRAVAGDLERTNVKLTEVLIGACEAAEARPHLLFSNSIHHERDTAYGRSKARSGQLLEAWAESRAAPFTNLILPNIFGEGGRAYYNSVVATFCQQLTTGSEPTVEDDREIELLHAQAAASAVLACMREQRLGDQRVKGQPIGVSQLLAKLREMLGSYRADILPDLQTGFELDLFNTLRYYLFPTHYPVRVVRRQDARGALFEVIKTMNGGQCFFSTTQPGVTRGNHYHRRKIERFMVVSGKARIRIRRLHCSDVTEFDVSGDLPEYVDIPTLHTHSITNVGSSELMTLFWANEIFDSQHPDTVAEKVRE